MKQQWILGFAALCILSWTTPIRADLVDHGDYSTPNLDYRDVTEVTPDSSLFFGAPTVVGDALVHLAAATDGSNLTSVNGGFDFTNGTLSMDISAKPGRLIHRVRVRHFGSISTFGLNSLAQIVSNGFAMVGTDVFSGSVSITASGNEVGGSFDETFEITFPETQSIVFGLQDEMFTFADVNSGFAFANTQGVIIEAFTVPIPEPVAGIALGSLVLVGMVGWRRRQALAMGDSV